MKLVLSDIEEGTDMSGGVEEGKDMTGNVEGTDTPGTVDEAMDTIGEAETAEHAVDVVNFPNVERVADVTETWLVVVALNDDVMAIKGSVWRGVVD